VTASIRPYHAGKHIAVTDEGRTTIVFANSELGRAGARLFCQQEELPMPDSLREEPAVKPQIARVQTVVGEEPQVTPIIASNQKLAGIDIIRSWVSNAHLMVTDGVWNIGYVAASEEAARELGKALRALDAMLAEQQS
jgi:hypothetical protein